MRSHGYYLRSGGRRKPWPETEEQADRRGSGIDVPTPQRAVTVGKRGNAKKTPRLATSRRDDDNYFNTEMHATKLPATLMVAMVGWVVALSVMQGNLTGLGYLIAGTAGLAGRWSWAWVPVAKGAAAAWGLGLIVYWDSSLPGVNPRSPLAASRRSCIQKDGFGGWELGWPDLAYTVAILFGTLVSALLLVENILFGET